MWGLHAPDHNTIVPLRNFVDVHVWVCLLAGMEGPVALRIRHGDGHDQVFVPEAAVEGVDVGLVHGVGLGQLP